MTLRPLPVLRGEFLVNGETVHVAFVPLTPAFLRGAAETQSR